MKEDNTLYYLQLKLIEEISLKLDAFKLLELLHKEEINLWNLQILYVE